jgi:hypothetical protein
MPYDERLKKLLLDADTYYDECRKKLGQAIDELNKATTPEEKRFAIASVQSAEAVLTTAAKHVKQALDMLASGEFTKKT